jgi:hypothetical protein
MNAIQRAAWERVRSQGRDRFLLRKIGRALGIGAVLFGCLHLVFVLFGKRQLIPSWDVVVEWAAISLFVGALYAHSEWQEKEQDYGEPNGDSEKH